MLRYVWNDLTLLTPGIDKTSVYNRDDSLGAFNETLRNIECIKRRSADASVLRFMRVKSIINPDVTRSNSLFSIEA